MINKDNIPAGLAEERRWLPGIYGKNGSIKGWNLPENWKELDDINGNAIFCMGDTDYLFIDADKVIDPVTNKVFPCIERDLNSIVNAGGETYVEKSQSGRGLHLMYDLRDCAGDYPKLKLDWKYPEYTYTKDGSKVIPHVEVYYHIMHLCYLTGDITPRSSVLMNDADGAMREILRIQEERGKPVGEGVKFEMPDEVPEGQRNTTTFRYACSLRANRVEPTEIYQRLIEFNNERNKPPLSDKELDRIYNSALKYPAGTSYEKLLASDPPSQVEETNDLQKKLQQIEPIKHYPVDDKNNGRLFANVFKNSLRYNPTAKSFMVYNGKRWRVDKADLFAHRAAQRLSDELLKYAIANNIDDGKYIQRVARLSMRSARTRMLEDAKPIFPFDQSQLDQDDLLLNVQNGTLNFHGDEVIFQHHNPGDLISKICNVSFDPGVNCPIWQKYLFDIFEGNENKMKYLQKLSGLFLTGVTCFERWWLLYGKKTRNGKGTYCETMVYILGDYARSMNPESLALRQKDGRQASGDIARLAGCRFVNVSEPDKNMRLDVGFIKKLTGNDTITARFLHQDDFEFRPKFKLVMNANYKPKVNDDSMFASDRVDVITFDRHFKPEERDLQLKDKLKEPGEASGILNWMIEGYYLYRTEGMIPPKEVAEATEEYRRDSDKLGLFFSEAMVKDSKCNAPVSAVYGVYQTWCEYNGYGCEGKQTFMSTLKDRDLWRASGTHYGKTMRNVIPGYRIVGNEA